MRRLRKQRKKLRNLRKHNEQQMKRFKLKKGKTLRTSGIGPQPMRVSTSNNAVRAYGINRSARSGVKYGKG